MWKRSFEVKCECGGNGYIFVTDEIVVLRKIAAIFEASVWYRNSLDFI